MLDIIWFLTAVSIILMLIGVCSAILMGLGWLGLMAYGTYDEWRREHIDRTNT